MTSTAPLRARLEVRLGSDLGPMDVVRAGRPTSPVAPTGSGWARGDVHVDVEGTGSVAVDGDDLVLAWDVDLPGRGSWHGSWELRAQDAAAVVVAPPAPAGWTERVEVASADVRLVRWVQRALADLEGLRMAHADRPDDVFVAAGAPWYLTLFGRDTLWTARLLLPLGWELAASTLRVLAHFQGVRNDPQTAEQPGKILHEVRPATADHGAMSLPPVYFGTVDATSLWICLLHEAWQRGMPDDQVAELLPTSRPRSAGNSRSARSSCTTSTRPGTGWPTRGGRTATTRCSGTTVRSPTPPSRCARCRRTRTRRPSPARSCSSTSVGTVPSTGSGPPGCGRGSASGSGWGGRTG